jgi:hypothetical protein
MTLVGYISSCKVTYLSTGKDQYMARVLSSEDVVRNVLQEAMEQGNQTDMEIPNSAELFEELRRDFPQAKIITLSMAKLLAAAQESDQSEEE